jgi:hypothetical protein
MRRQEAEFKRRSEAVATAEGQSTAEQARRKQVLAQATGTTTRPSTLVDADLSSNSTTVLSADSSSNLATVLDADSSSNLAIVLQRLASEMSKPKNPPANAHKISNGKALRNLTHELSKITNDPTNCSMMQCIAQWNQRFHGERRSHEIISEKEAIRAWKGMMTQRVTGAQQINEHVTNAQGTEVWTVEEYIVQWIQKATGEMASIRGTTMLSQKCKSATTQLYWTHALKYQSQITALTELWEMAYRVDKKLEPPTDEFLCETAARAYQESVQDAPENDTVTKYMHMMLLMKAQDPKPWEKSSTSSWM